MKVAISKLLRVVQLLLSHTLKHSARQAVGDAQIAPYFMHPLEAYRVDKYIY